jgi:hypothetical protein
MHSPDFVSRTLRDTDWSMQTGMSAFKRRCLPVRAIAACRMSDSTDVSFQFDGG